MAEDDATLVHQPARQPGGGAVEHILLVQRPGESLQRIALGAQPLRIGRVAGNDLVLPLPDISRQHCTVQVAAGHGVLADLGSTNGTWIEGRRIAEPTALADGTIIGLGSFSLVYRCGPPALLARAIAAEEELKRAGDYVRALLPAPLAQGPVRTDWRFEPSAAVGGDAFGYHCLPDGRWAIYLLDVTGHGAGSALLAVSVLNVLRQAALPQGLAWHDAGGVLAALNEMFPMEQQGGLCMSAWYGLFDPATRRLHYASAGQHPAYLRAQGGGALLPLATRNMMLGAMSGVPFLGAEVTVPPASRLYLFSDGAFEIAAPDGTQRTLKDFLPVLEATAEPGLAEADRLLRAARQANGPRPFEDDVSVLVLDFT